MAPRDRIPVSRCLDNLRRARRPIDQRPLLTRRNPEDSGGDNSRRSTKKKGPVGKSGLARLYYFALAAPRNSRGCIPELRGTELPWCRSTLQALHLPISATSDRAVQSSREV